MGYNGIGVAKQIHDILKNNHMETEVVAASFKNTQQVLELCAYGVGAVTVASDVHIPQELRIRSRGTERHSASN